MHITLGGVLMIVGIGVVIIAIMVINRLIHGEPVTVKSINMPGKKKDDGTVLCLNIYPDKIVGETMLTKSIAPDADVWGLANKKYRLQGIANKIYQKVVIPDTPRYPAERLARLPGCMPLRKFKASKRTWYQHLAPFAPVVALIIVVLFFYLMAN